MARRRENKGKPSLQSQNWVFTIFSRADTSLEEIEARFYEMTSIEKTNIASLAYGYEICPRTNRNHFQGFLQTFKKGMINSRGAS